MTWLRVETDFPDHDVIGTFAERLRCDPDRAAMCLLRVWCGFADHAPDGFLAKITDTTLERWARWPGKRGAFAELFREVAVDEDGKVRGWWRQEALLRKQEKDRTRPSSKDRNGEPPPDIPPKNPPNSPGGIAGESRGNRKGDEDEDGSKASSSTARARNGVPQRLEDRLQGEPLAPGVFAFLAALPQGQNPAVWRGILAGCLDGMGLAQGRAASVSELAAACGDFMAENPERWKPNHFKAFVDTAIARMRRAAPTGTGGAKGGKSGFKAAADRARAREAAKSDA